MFSTTKSTASMKKDITNLFVLLDDFCNFVDFTMKSKLVEGNHKVKRPTRKAEMSTSEILTIILLYHQSPCKNFKYFYNSYLTLYKSDFPKLITYERFIALKPRSMIYLCSLLEMLIGNSKSTGIAFIDATKINVCNSKRTSQNKVFKGLAKIGKSSMGWFYGFKLHLVINDRAEIQSVRLTQGNVDDRSPVENMLKKFTGIIFGDKGYISSELTKNLQEKGVKLVTGLKKNMKNVLMSIFDKKMLKKRSIIETVFDYLKNKFEIEHTRHRSSANAFVHIISTLVSYSLKPNKPKVKYDTPLTQF
jgi:hypothetical protein